MGKKHVVLLLTLTTLVILSGAYIAGGVQAYSRYQQSSLQKQEYCGGQAPVHICIHAPTAIFSAFYPSYLATQYSLFTVDYSSSSPLTLIISVSIAHFSQVQTQTLNATSASQSSTFIPPLQDQALRYLTTERSSSLHVQVTDTRGYLYYLNDAPVTLHSRWLMQWTTTNRLKVAAWVTPNDPAVVALVTRAANHLNEQQPPVPAGMIGYRSATAQQVIDQVDAIYDTLRLDYHIRYLQASVPYSANGSDSTATQNIKLPAEVLQQRSGMCVELTTLLAAAVEQIGLSAEIVIIPGHAFLGVAVTEGATHFEYWDGVDVNNNVAADSANVAADSLYQKNLDQHTIIDVIQISKARNAHIGPML
ncbi:MAG TPA: transglutaminase family protein [Ktedonobacteraceae bacterium]|nr:transglutaminase family protein [Ktedonobacteraceae bacterium]